MGIKGIKNIIKKNAPNALKQLNVSDLKGSRVIIDSSILLYRYRYLHKEPYFHILGFLHKVIELLENKITPIFVFDGKPPDAKKEIIQSRIDSRNKMNERLSELKESLPDQEYIDSDDESTAEVQAGVEKILREIQKLEKNNLVVKKVHSLETIELLESLGIQCLIAEGEAEEYCSFLQKKGIADYVVTEDTDSLTFGATKVLFNKNILCTLEDILSSFNISYLQFIDLCILCGCDYTCTIPKIGPVTALNIIKEYGSIESFLDNNVKYNVPENFNYVLARELFLANENLTVPVIKKNIFNKEKLISILEKHKINNQSILFFVNKINKLIN